MTETTDLAAQVDAAVKANLGDTLDKAIADGFAKMMEEAKPESPIAKLFSPGVNRGADDRDKRNGVQKMASFIGFMAEGKGDPERAAKIAKASGDEFMAKSLTMTDFTAGGALVPTEYLDDYFEALRPKSIIRAMGAQTIDLVNGNATLPGITGGATASYKGEAQPANATGVTTGDVRLTEKELIAIVPVSTSMFRSRGGRNTQMISNDMLRAMSQAENVNFLNGDGTNNKPLGILQQAASGNIAAASGAALANADTDIASLVNVLEAANVDVTSGAFFTTSTIFNNLMKLRSGDMYAYPELRDAAAKLWTYPAFKSNNVPSGYLGFANMADVIIGDSQSVEVTMSEEAAYIDANGTMQAAFSRNEVVMRVVAKHDIALRYTASVSAKTGATYAGS